MSIDGFAHSPPNNESHLETYCLALFARHLRVPNLQRYANRGDAQDGLDLLGVSETGDVVGVQCKLRAARGTLTKRDLLADVAKARAFRPALDQFVVATTARRSRELQAIAARITRRHKGQRKFSVTVYAWPDIEELLKLYEDVRDQLYQTPVVQHLETLSAGMRQVLIAVETTDRGSDPDAVHAEIDEAFSHALRGEPTLALFALDKLEKRRWDKIDARARYRIKANRGNALALQNRLREAASLYLEAATYQPANEQARAFAALAHVYLDDRKEACRLADELCRDHPRLARAHAIRIQCVPTWSGAADIVRALPAGLSEDSEIAAAISKRAAEAGDFEDAEIFARLALKGSPDWAEAKVALAVVLIQSQRAQAIIDPEGAMTPIDPGRVREAERLLTEIIECHRERDPGRMSPSVFAHRAAARQLLNDGPGSLEDARIAHQAEPANPEIALGFAITLQESGDPARAISVMQSVQGSTCPSKLQLRLALGLLERSGNGDADLALTALETGLTHLSQEDRRFRLFYVDVYADTVRRVRGADGLNAATGALNENLVSPWALGVVRARAIAAGGDKSLATTLASAALALGLGEALPEEKALLAALLERLGRMAESFAVWRSTAKPAVLDLHAIHAVRSGYLHGDHAWVMDFCRQARTAGVLDRRLAETEFELLVRYREHDEAAELLKQFLVKHTGDPWALVNRSILGLRHNRPEWVVADASLYPPVESVDPAMGRGIVVVLCEGPRRADAVVYAYRLLRRFPDSEEANQAMIGSLFVPVGSEPALERPTVAGPGTAVAIKEEGVAEPRWVFIEDDKDPPPTLSRGEYAPDHALAKALAGKAVGDEVEIASGPLGRKHGRIVNVDSKLVVRAQLCMARWQENFPDHSFVSEVHLPLLGEPGVDPQAALAPMIEPMQRLDEARRECEKQYRDSPIPLPCVARALGKSVVETTMHMASEPDLPIRCGPGHPRSLAGAVSRATSLPVVVIDPTALTTLFLLDAGHLLDKLPFKRLVPSSAIAEFRGLIETYRNGQERAFVGVREGGLWMTNIPEDVARMQDARVLAFIEQLLCSCEPIGGEALARIDRKLSKHLQEHYPDSSIDAVSAAIYRGAALWTDDGPSAEGLARQFKLPTLWTHPVLLAALERASMTREEVSLAIAKLVAWEYTFVGVGADVVVAACRAADWNPDRFPAKRVLDHFSNPDLDLRPLATVLYSSIVRVWQTCPLEESAGFLTLRILDRVASRLDGRQLVEALKNDISKLFGLDVIRGDRARRVVAAFLAMPSRKIILAR